MYDQKLILAAALVALSTGPAKVALAESNDRAACAVERDKVAGGWPAKLSNWPGFASLRLLDVSNQTAYHLCGGTMIAPEWMLTAGHCVFLDDPKEPLDVRKS